VLEVYDDASVDVLVAGALDFKAVHGLVVHSWDPLDQVVAVRV